MYCSWIQLEKGRDAAKLGEGGSQNSKNGWVTNNRIMEVRWRCGVVDKWGEGGLNPLQIMQHNLIMRNRSLFFNGDLLLITNPISKKKYT